VIVALVGADGTGKSSLARQLAERLPGGEYVYLGHNLESRRYRFGARFFRRKRPRSIMEKISRAFVMYMDDLLIVRHGGRGRLVTDRYPFDHLVQARVFRQKTRLGHQLLAHIFPNPDLVVLLHGDPRLIHARKEDLDTDKIQRYTDTYKSLLEDRKARYIQVDTASLQPESCIRTILAALRE